MAKAALEAIGGFNLFGYGHGATWSTIMVCRLVILLDVSFRILVGYC